MSALVAFWLICVGSVLINKVHGTVLVSVLVAHLHMKFNAINALSKRCDLIASWCSVLVPSFFHMGTYSAYSGALGYSSLLEVRLPFVFC